MMLDIKSKQYETMIEEMKQGKKSIKTPWGTANINKDKGYYIITSTEFFNNRVHRLIWQDFYGKELPQDYVIHHLDSNKLNNAVNNLQCVERSKHTSFHFKGKNHPQYKDDLNNDLIYDLYLNKKLSEKEIGRRLGVDQGTIRRHLEEMGVERRSLSEATSLTTNSIGYYRVDKENKKDCKQGFLWRYRYYDDNGKRKNIRSVDIKKLEEKVRKKGLPWKKL